MHKVFKIFITVVVIKNMYSYNTHNKTYENMDINKKSYYVNPSPKTM